MLPKAGLAEEQQRGEDHRAQNSWNSGQLTQLCAAWHFPKAWNKTGQKCTDGLFANTLEGKWWVSLESW